MTVTEQAIEVSTDTIPAGYVLLTVWNNQSAQVGSTGAGLFGPPPRMSMAEYEALMQAPPSEEEL